MCGICGIVKQGSRKVEEGSLRSMLRELLHRGPDDEGVYFKETSKCSVALGHRRLSIIDLSGGRQPIFNEDKSIVIVLNGEIYNFRELRDELEKRGHSFQTHSDTEVVVHLYEDYGEKCLNYLRGAWAFAIWDEKNSRLFLARDRVGKRPLLYAFHNGDFIFASEFKALLAYPGISKEINLEALDAYMSYGYVPAPLSIFKAIFKVLPANYLILEGGNIKAKKYWSLNFREKINLPEDEICRRIREGIRDAVEIRMISDVPLGAFLSGGIDSSIVVGLMSELSNKRIKTFSIGFNEESYNELNYARIVAKKFNTEHEEFIVTPDIKAVLPLLAERFGEPYADSSAVPSYYLAKMTRSRVSVALNGDGGDELFAGYQRYLANRLACSRYIKAFLAFGGGTLFKKLIPDGLSPKNFLAKLKRFFQAASDEPVLRYSKWVGFFEEDVKSGLYSAHFKNWHKNFDALQWPKEIFREAEGLDGVDTFLYADTMLNLPNDLLVKMDIACMANSLEGRSPFLDYRLMEFAASIPSELKVKNNISKYILRKSFRDILPLEIAKRAKMGFALPLGYWLRSELKNFVEGELLSEKCLKRGYFNPAAIKGLLKEHFAAKKDLTHQLWALLMLELWHQKFID